MPTSLLAPGVTVPRAQVGDLQCNEEDRWSQATLSQATLAQASQAGGIADQEPLETLQSPDPGQSPDTDPLSNLLTLPPNIRAIREQVFCLR